MSTVNGLVEAKGKDNKRIRVQGKWYSTFKEASLNGAEAGDHVEFEFVEKGQWLNIKGDVKVILKGQGVATTPSGNRVGFIGLDRERSIARQNALTNAREVVLSRAETTIEGLTLEGLAEEIIKIAYIFEAYTTGDLEKNQALEAINTLANQAIIKN